MTNATQSDVEGLIARIDERVRDMDSIGTLYDLALLNEAATALRTLSRPARTEAVTQPAVRTMREFYEKYLPASMCECGHTKEQHTRTHGLSTTACDKTGCRCSEFSGGVTASDTSTEAPGSNAGEVWRNGWLAGRQNAAETITTHLPNAWRSFAEFLDRLAAKYEGPDPRSLVKPEYRMGYRDGLTHAAREIRANDTLAGLALDPAASQSDTPAVAPSDVVAEYEFRRNATTMLAFEYGAGRANAADYFASRDALDALVLPALEAQTGWIPVSERLPEPYADCWLACCGDRVLKGYRMPNLRNEPSEMYVRSDESDDIEDVTHWQVYEPRHPALDPVASQRPDLTVTTKNVGAASETQEGE